jgi:hypothetical protein
MTLALLLQQAAGMILRIEQESLGEIMILRLIGRVESQHLPDLKAQTENDSRTILLDLAEVQLVDRDVVRFLRQCEECGIQMRNCPPYIREWILLDRQTERGRK